VALPAFDAAKHHVKLGVSGGGSFFGFVLDGAYAHSLQRENTVPGASEFGATLDLIARADSPNLSRWSQEDFTGGGFSFRFDNDPAMFMDSTGYIPGQQSKSLQSVPPVVLRCAFDPLGEDQFGYSDDDCSIPRQMFTVAGSVYVVFKHGILRYRQDTGSTQWGNWIIDTDHYYVDAQYDLNEQIIYVLVGTTTGTDAPKLLRLSPTLLDTSPYAIGSFEPDTPLPKTIGKAAKGMQIMGQNIVVGIGLRLYTCAPPEDVTDVLSLPTWTHIGRLPGYWIDSVAYNGLIYILCGAVDGKTYLVAFDGTAVLPVCELPFNFRGHCLCVYGGRVYCGGSGTGLTAGERFAELYEVTGASVRLVRTFADQYHNWNSAHFPKQIWDLTVEEGLLWMSQKGEKLWAYDLTSDGFFGASQLPESEAIVFFKQSIGKERLWLWGRHDTDAAQHGLYSIAEDNAQLAEGGYDVYVQTSNFVIEPALDKNWKKLVVLCQGTAATCEWSKDGGETWNAFDSSTTITDSSNMVYTTCVFPADTSSRHMAFKITQPGLDITSNAILAYTASFEFADPSAVNSMRNGWQFTVLGAESHEAYDGSTETVTPGEIASQLFDWAKNQTLLAFTDVDGTDYTVRLQAITEQRPRIGPRIDDGAPEAYYSVSLLEATA
jgi:hypothetical protein